MTLTTKYSPGDTVYFLYENEIQEGTATTVRANARRENSGDVMCGIIYSVSFQTDCEDLHESFREDDLFPSAEALTDELVNNWKLKNKEVPA